MMKNRLIWIFSILVVVMVFFRIFAYDLVSISNDVLVPDFYPGDFLFVSKVSSVSEGSWVLLRDYPRKSVFSVRQIVKEVDQGWIVKDPALQNQPVTVAGEKVVGRVALILWSLPCRKDIAQDSACQKSNRFFVGVP